MSEEFSTDGMVYMYLLETGRLLAQLESEAERIREGESLDAETLNRMFRTTHTIKGTSGIMMFDNIMTVSHKLEDILHYLRDAKADADGGEVAGWIAETVEFIRGELQKIGKGKEPDRDASELLLGMDNFLSALKERGGESAVPSLREEKEGPSQFYIAPVAKGSSRFYQIRLVYERGADLRRIQICRAVDSLGEISEEIYYTPEDIFDSEDSIRTVLDDGFRILLKTQSDMAKVKGILEPLADVQRVELKECGQEEFARGFGFSIPIQIDLDASVEEIQEKIEDNRRRKTPPVPGDFVLKPKEPGKPMQFAGRRQQEREASQRYIAVDADKMRSVMELVEELACAQRETLQSPDLAASGSKLSHFRKASARMTHTFDELREMLTSIWMVPLAGLFHRMNRLVSDISGKQGKSVEFAAVGEENEVDKGMAEQLQGILAHLVRNAVDHGIETDDERLQAGKKERGRVMLTAEKADGELVITVLDNGRGLERERILRKAESRGLLAKPAEEYTAEETYLFVVKPGFTTSDEVTEYSGRGVGLDAVSQDIQSMGGRLEIESEQGEGTAMTLYLPVPEGEKGGTGLVGPGTGVGQAGERDADEVRYIADCG